jgi:hypothetical protein
MTTRTHPSAVVTGQARASSQAAQVLPAVDFDDGPAGRIRETFCCATAIAD